MQRIRTNQRQRLLFQPPVKTPRWEQLTHSTQRRVISRLAVMLRQHRASNMHREEEINHE